MPEPEKIPSQPQGEPQKDVQKPEPPKEDIVTRVSKVTPEANGAGESSQQTERFDPKELDEIKDPVLKERMKNTYAEMDKGVQAKFREADQMKKDAQAQAALGWTPERLQAELKRDDFLSSAQYLNSQQTAKNNSGGELSDTEWSALTPAERTEMVNMRQGMQAMKGELNSMRTRQEDDTLKGRYANYDPNKVSALQQDLMTGKYQAGRQDIWKVYDYEDAVKRAYALGQQDKQADVAGKVNALSPNGLNSTPAQEVPAKEAKESGPAYFVRLAQRRMAEMGRKT